MVACHLFPRCDKSPVTHDINAVMFVVEIGAGVAAMSVSLQADPLDFMGDAANYTISLAVLGMAMRWHARAALMKGVSMAVFGVWVIGSTVWHTVQGTLPEAVGMGKPNRKSDWAGRLCEPPPLGGDVIVQPINLTEVSSYDARGFG